VAMRNPCTQLAVCSVVACSLNTKALHTTSELVGTWLIYGLYVRNGRIPASWRMQRNTRGRSESLSFWTLSIVWNSK
jgi:hypothetical protein